MASPSLCIFILGKSYVGSKTFAFLAPFGPDYKVPLLSAFSQHHLLAVQGPSLGGRQ